jgi:lipoate-protein ligase A
MNGEANMAMDMALLEQAATTAEPVLRLYSWDSPTLSLGYFQKAEETADLAGMRRRGVALVRRPTGGGAILHHQEITISLILPAGHPMSSIPVVDSYLTFSSPLLNVLRSLGLEASFRGGGKGGQSHAANCFAGRAGADLVVGGLKIFGSAQRRRKQGVLFHGSLLLAVDQELWRDVFGSRMGEGFCGLGNSPHPGELRKLICKEYEALLGGLREDIDRSLSGVLRCSQG